MKITRRCPFSGQVKTRDLDITQLQVDRYQSGRVLIQDAFPNLNAEEREFFKTGIDGDAWNKHLGEEDE